MEINKIVYGSETLIDLTNDTVEPSSMALGTTAHDASGALITGTAVQVHVVTEIDSNSTDTEVPTAKAVYDFHSNAVSTNEQSLTEAQQMQARKNQGLYYRGEELTDTITWDGNIYDKEYIAFENSILVKILDYNFTDDQLNNLQIEYVINAYGGEYLTEEATLRKIEDLPEYTEGPDNYIIFVTEPSVISQNPVTPGLYVIYVPEVNAYISKCTFNGLQISIPVYHTIDHNYLKDMYWSESVEADYFYVTCPYRGEAPYYSIDGEEQILRASDKMVNVEDAEEHGLYVYLNGNQFELQLRQSEKYETIYELYQPIYGFTIGLYVTEETENLDYGTNPLPNGIYILDWWEGEQIKIQIPDTVLDIVDNVIQIDKKYVPSEIKYFEFYIDYLNDGVCVPKFTVNEFNAAIDNYMIIMKDVTSKWYPQYYYYIGYSHDWGYTFSTPLAYSGYQCSLYIRTDPFMMEHSVYDIDDELREYTQFFIEKPFIQGENGQVLMTDGTEYGEYWGTIPTNYVSQTQGVSHAGEFLVVGSNGEVTTQSFSEWQGGNY